MELTPEHLAILQRVARTVSPEGATALLDLIAHLEDKAARQYPGSGLFDLKGCALAELCGVLKFHAGSPAELGSAHG